MPLLTRARAVKSTLASGASSKITSILALRTTTVSASRLGMIEVVRQKGVGIFLVIIDEFGDVLELLVIDFVLVVLRLAGGDSIEEPFGVEVVRNAVLVLFETTLQIFVPEKLLSRQDCLHARDLLGGQFAAQLHRTRCEKAEAVIVLSLTKSVAQRLQDTIVEVVTDESRHHRTMNCKSELIVSLFFELTDSWNVGRILGFLSLDANHFLDIGRSDLLQRCFVLEIVHSVKCLVGLEKTEAPSTLETESVPNRDNGSYPEFTMLKSLNW